MNRKVSSRTDGDMTRQKILTTSGLLFAANGFSETTNKSIAHAAQVDLASINYHFKNRNGLYQCVLAEAHRSIIRLEDLTAIHQLTITADEKLLKLMEIIYSHAFEEHRWQIQVLSREILSPTSNFATLLDNEVLPKIQLIKSILSEVSGIPINSPTLLPCLISSMAPYLMLIVTGRNQLTPLQPLKKIPQHQLVNQLYTFVLAGLKAVGKQELYI